MFDNILQGKEIEHASLIQEYTRLRKFSQRYGDVIVSGWNV